MDLIIKFDGYTVMDLDIAISSKVSENLLT